MARTVKTTPWWVRMAASPHVLAVEEHDHRNGICDLPDTPGGTHAWWPREGHCGWVPSNAMYYGPGHGCGCQLCTDREERKAKARRDRRQSKAIGRQMRKGLWADVDVDELG